MKFARAPSASLFLAATAPFVLAACSSSDPRPLDAGERMSARGVTIAAKGEAWTDGQRDVRQGTRLVERSSSRTADGEKKLKHAQEAAAKAERQIQVAQADRTNGEQLIADGTKQMQQAEAAYADIRKGPAAIEPR